MPVTAAVAIIVGTLALMLIVIKALDVVRDVRLARWTGQDPRQNPDAVAEAAAKVASRRQHPSGGDETPSKEK